MKELRIIREERGLKRKFIASKLGICPDHLNFIERGGTKLKPQYVNELAKIYNISIEEMEEAAIKTYKKRG